MSIWDHPAWTCDAPISMCGYNQRCVVLKHHCLNNYIQVDVYACRGADPSSSLCFSRDFKYTTWIQNRSEVTRAVHRKHRVLINRRMNPVVFCFSTVNALKSCYVCFKDFISALKTHLVPTLWTQPLMKKLATLCFWSFKELLLYILTDKKLITCALCCTLNVPVQNLYLRSQRQQVSVVQL